MSRENNWAVLICTSKYWFNYRHLSNTLTLYRIIKRLGFTDDHIIFMNANDATCDARNPLVGEIYNNPSYVDFDLFYGEGDMIEIDYRGLDVNPESFRRILTGNHYTHTPASKRLQLNSLSNVLIYMSGHGGDEFMKFHDHEEFSAEDFAEVVLQMEFKKRFREMLIIVETCQASTLTSRIHSKGVVSITSSGKGENSYAYVPNENLGVPVIDRFTYSLDEYFKQFFFPLSTSKRESVTLQHLISSFDSNFIRSNPVIQSTNGTRNVREISLLSFFGMSQSSRVTLTPYPFLYQKNGTSIKSFNLYNDPELLLFGGINDNDYTDTPLDFINIYENTERLILRNHSTLVVFYFWIVFLLVLMYLALSRFFYYFKIKL